MNKILNKCFLPSAIVGILFTSAAFASTETGDSSCGDPAIEAPKVADRYFDAFNASDFVTNASALHFPSYMITPKGDFYAFSDLESYVEMLNGFEAYWHHEHVVGKDILQSSPKKVHVAIKASRYDDKNILINTHESLWIVTCVDGEWGIKARSHLER